jgi:hypothetical protein
LAQRKRFSPLPSTRYAELIFTNICNKKLPCAKPAAFLVAFVLSSLGQCAISASLKHLLKSHLYADGPNGLLAQFEKDRDTSLVKLSASCITCTVQTKRHRKGVLFHVRCFRCLHSLGGCVSDHLRSVLLVGSDLLSGDNDDHALRLIRHSLKGALVQRGLFFTF